MRSEVWAGGGRAWAGSSAHERYARGEGPAVEAWGAKGMRGAHREHAAHGCDARRIEAERLVERRRALPRVASRGVRGAGRAARAPGGGRRRATAVHTQRAEGTARDCRLGGRARGEVRTENIIFMFVTLDVSNVSGWLKPDAAWRGLKEGAHGSGRAARVGKREAAGDRGARSVKGRAQLQIVGHGARGKAHQEHPAHVRDAGRGEAERLVELMRVLPRVARGGHTVRGELRGPGGSRRREGAGKCAP